MSFSRVDQLADQIRGVSYSKTEVSDQPRQGYLPVLRANNISENGLQFDDLVYVPVERISQKQLLQRGDVVIAASSGSLEVVGKAAQVDSPFEGTFGAFCKVLRPKKVVHPKYFSFYFKTPLYRHIISNKAAGANINNLRNEDLDSLEMYLPTYDEQERISGVLEKIQSALEKRREAIRLLDDFLKSTFLEMFGDPVYNQKKWPLQRFGTVFTSIRYGTGSPPSYVQTGIPFIRATNVKNGTVISRDMKDISIIDARKIEKCKVSFGNLIVVRSGVNAGDTGLVPKQYDKSYAAYDLIIELPYPTAVYFNHILNSEYGKAKISPLKRRAGQPHLNADQIASLEFPVPPLEFQKNFVTAIERIENLRQKMKSSETELRNLFAALMQKAFKEK